MSYWRDLRSNQTVWDGWCRFWYTFNQPWAVVFGFALASLVSSVLAHMLSEVLLWILGKLLP